MVDQSKIELNKLKKKLSKYKTKTLEVECNLEIEENRIELLNTIKSKKIKIDCLINNAAMTGSSIKRGWNSNFQHQTIKMWRKGIEVNLTAAVHLSQIFMSDLEKSNGANIINIASIYGELDLIGVYMKALICNPAAIVSKGGLIQFTRWAATTMAPKIRVNAISPGGIKEISQKFIKKHEARTPLKRMATELDMIGVLLATDMSAYITGQVIRVDGG